LWKYALEFFRYPEGQRRGILSGNHMYINL
jgi:hypothetical protein